MNTFLTPLSFILTSKLHRPKCLIATCTWATHIRRNSTKMSKEDIFQGKIDRHKGVTVHSEQEKCSDIEDFRKRLQESLLYWKKNGKKTLWFRIHLANSNWVPVLAEKGFQFHHAKEDYVMMYKWLPTSENINLPHYAHTMLGAGAIVVNKKNQMLVVTEKTKMSTNSVPHWKLPGGYVERGENLGDAAIREVYEETGIQTEFDSIVSFRHTHKRAYGCSDIYVIVSLIPLSEDIQKCDEEIENAKWMDIEEFMNRSDVIEMNQIIVLKYLDCRKSNIKIECMHGVHKLLNIPFTLYSAVKVDNK